MNWQHPAIFSPHTTSNKTMKITIFTLVVVVMIFFSSYSLARGHEDFLGCLAHVSNIVHTDTNSTFKSVLHSSIQNLRFTSDSTPKPFAIITPEYESQIPHVIYCAKRNGIQIRSRSGGHDLEGLSYVSQVVPFVILDMMNLSEISVDVEKRTAWVQSGAIVGTLYYKIAEKSPTLGFPAGLCHTVGVGGHISGGGYGTLMRKYGFAADNIIDARIVDANGMILDRESMGEDLFWAMRGGGGASFGVILAWKLRLVHVPHKVTVFTIHKTLEQNAIQLIHKWQYMANKIDEDLFIRNVIRKDGPTIVASFNSLFLGETDRLLSIMQQSFPELGLVRQDCVEMSWIESVLHFAMFPYTESPQVLLNRILPFVPHFKVKSDYVEEPISEIGIQGIWKLLEEVETAEIGFSPHGGRMDDISESSIPYPHRAGNLYLVEYIVFWESQNMESYYINWIRKLYSYMTPYVSKSPRAAYINYRDLDIGVNNGNQSYEVASIWGTKYFKNNFDRLVRVKSIVDPTNFFRDEQSIPPIKLPICDGDLINEPINFQSFK